MDDKQIIRLLWQRDEKALGIVSAQYGSYCRSIAQNILRNDSDTEECINDAFLRLWNTIPPEKPGNLKLYLARILRNLALDRYRANTAAKRNSAMEEVLDELEDVLPGSGTPEDTYMAKELSKAINRFASALPQRERDLFVRRYFFTDDISTIARKYRMTAHNVTVTLSRVRQKLRQHLIQEGFLDG